MIIISTWKILFLTFRYLFEPGHYLNSGLLTSDCLQSNLGKEMSVILTALDYKPH